MSSGNDYVLQIKGNQPRLLAHLQAVYAADPAPAGASHTHRERRDGQVSTWYTSVHDCADAALGRDWAGLARFVVVVKTVVRGGQTTRRWHGYITSLRTLPAAELAAGIRGHWGIENKLHRARDVQFGQDTNGIRHATAAANVALFNTFALNFLLTTVHPSLSFAQIMFAQNIKEFLTSLRT